VDVLVLSALLPSVFITSLELKNTPLLGLLAGFGGSLFVDRRRPAGLKQEVEEIARVLKQGFSVVLFPEGTTSNGDRVQPFKRSLFDSAVLAGVDILPVCIRYQSINGQPVSPANRDGLFYYGGIAFTRHFPRFLALTSVVADPVPLKAIRPAEHSSRKELAAAAHELISTAYRR
jgi:1-acyl-sn-glycerol-3-phosphate acyltransferase